MSDEPTGDQVVQPSDVAPDGESGLSEGQKERLRIFRSVERGTCLRIEQLCEMTGIEVTDVAVLVIAPRAHDLFFADAAEDPGTDVVIGHRTKLRAFLNTVLPPASETDPYIDLLEPTPARYVRVLVIDDEAITVLSYGSFVTVRISRNAPSA